MIYFVVGAVGSFSIRYYLAEEGVALADRMRVIEYQELAKRRSLPLGTWVFTESDTRTGPERALAALACDRLLAAGANVRVMNHPARVASRLDLLRAAYDAGLNRHRAFPAPDVASGAVPAHDMRYPVFVRHASRHDGSLTPLLRSVRELQGALGRIVATRQPLHTLLVVEFCDTKDAHGIYRKYAAFRVGDRILPRVLECSREWMVKWDHRIFDDERAAEESHFLAHNPHEDWIRDVFRLANIEYGRIDYGVVDGRPQVWEINTNPTIGRPPGKIQRNPVVLAYKDSLSPGYDSFYRGFLEAWCAVDTAADPTVEIELDPPPELLRAIEAAGKRREHEARREARIVAILGRPWMRPIVHVAKRALRVAATARLRRRPP